MESSSNITNSEDMCKKFYREALKVTNSLKYRYFSVFEKMTAEDIVMECFVKVLKGNISYDDSKGCKFETFVRMIVTCQLTDELKWLNASKRSGTVVSLDSEVSGVEGEEESSSLYNTIGDMRSQHHFEYLETKRDLEEIERDLESVNNFILELSERGYTISDIAVLSDMEKVTIKNRLKDIREIYQNRSEGISVRISEILYGEDEIREARGNDLISISSHIVDDITGVKLSDIVKLVFKDYSYKMISDKLDISVRDIKRFLSRYESVMI